MQELDTVCGFRNRYSIHFLAHKVYSDKARLFALSGYINGQNNRYWRTENSGAAYEVHFVV
jgi:hypothetical protein